MNRLNTLSVAALMTHAAVLLLVVVQTALFAVGFAVVGGALAGFIVPLPEGVFPSLGTTTVMPFPCVQRNARENALNRSSRSGEGRDLMRATSGPTCLASPIDEVVLYSY